VVASDLEEEAPLWWLRVKQAAERGAALVILNPRSTRLDGHAKHLVRYSYGSEAAAVLALVNALSAKRPDLPEAVQSLGRDPQLQEAARELAGAENLVIFYGSDGLGLAGSQALAQACTNLLLVTGHLGQPNNGLVGVWRRANDQGAWEMGWRPIPDLAGAIDRVSAVYLAAADPVGDDPRFHSGSFGEKGFVVVQELFLTPTARLADVVLPAQSWAEREGSLTSGERRVQRFYPAIHELEGTLADYKITTRIAASLGIDLEMRSPARVFQTLADKIPAFNGLSYANLSHVEEQWPLIGRSDLYYGGTTYDNQHGLGFTLPLQGNGVSLAWPALPEVIFPRFGLLAVPVTRLYDHGTTLLPSLMLKERIPAPYVCINPADAERLHINEGAAVRRSDRAYLRGDPRACFACPAQLREARSYRTCD